MAPTENHAHPPSMGIGPLLRSLRPVTMSQPIANAEDIAFAVSNVFTNELSEVETALLLYTLSLTGLEQRPDVLARCATAMRTAAVPLDIDAIQKEIKKKEIVVGEYYGGLCDIVGTGGDYHSTFNISTASSIICSSLLRIAKHGNRASTSKSGSADVLAAMKLAPSTHTTSETTNGTKDDTTTNGTTKSTTTALSPKLEAVTPTTLSTTYTHTNYTFLFAPNFHTGLRHISSLRKLLPCPTLFNLLGPLTNPAESLLEARILGVKRTDLVPVFAEALLINGTRKGMVVCGAEDLDEISCAGDTICARLVVQGERDGDPNWGEEGNAPGADTVPRAGQGDATHVDWRGEVSIEHFVLKPRHFGLPRHALSDVSPGRTADENAEILGRLLRGKMGPEDPILHFVLMNAAALFVVAGAAEAETCPFGSGEVVVGERGPGGGRWKEGVRLARLAIRTGRAMEMLVRFAEITNL